jgi:predicted MPP superfamily phosphohydrolase
MLAFFYIFSLLLAILYTYTGFRLIPALFRKKSAFVAWFLLFVFWAVLSAHVYFRVTDTWPDVSRPFAWLGYSWLGVMSYLFCLTLIRDGGLVFAALFSRLKRLLIKKRGLLSPSVERRQFLYRSSSTAITVLSLSLGATGAWCALQRPRVIRIPIHLPVHLAGLNGLTLAQFTDLHVGPTVGYAYVKQVCDIIGALCPDMIVFTGDLIDGHPDHLQGDIAPLKDLNAPLGNFFITGNHEYYSGVEPWLDQVVKLGFLPLLNEHRVIDYHQTQLTLAGVTDSHSRQIFPKHQWSPERAIRNAPENSYKLLLAHQPSDVYAAAQAGFDYQISGHTHGGQYYPFGYAVNLLHPFVKGLYKYKNTFVYVNQGTGYWGPPMRIGTFPEITLFTFTSSGTI